MQPLLIRYWPVTAFLLIHGVGAVAWATTVHGNVERTNESIAIIERKLETGSTLVTEHKTVIPIIQQDIRELKEAVKSMSQKQDRQFEEIMRAVRQ